MSTILLYIGLICIPYYELLVRLLPYSVALPSDTRVAKLFVSIGIALAIGLYGLYSQGFRPICNKWLLLLLVFIPLNIHLAPKFEILVNGNDSTNYWVWKPFLMCLCFFLMFMAVQSLNITRDSIKKIFNVMAWCGVVMAGYCILQNFGFDQFFSKRLGNEFLKVTQPLVVGSLGNSTVVSPYIAMLIPFALYLRRYLMALVMVYAVWLCQSEMAIGAMIVSLALFSCLRWRSRGVLIIVLSALLALSIGSWQRYINPHRFDSWVSRVGQDNGRMAVWKDIVRVVKDEEIGLKEKSRYPFTGTGIGSYSFVIRQLVENKNYNQAHNDYLEVWATMGWVGLGLFLMSIIYMLMSAFNGYLDYNQVELSALLASFVCIALVAFGTFVFQLAPHNFYTVLIAGLLHNRNLIKGGLA